MITVNMYYSLFLKGFIYSLCNILMLLSQNMYLPICVLEAIRRRACQWMRVALIDMIGDINKGIFVVEYGVATCPCVI